MTGGYHSFSIACYILQEADEVGLCFQFISTKASFGDEVDDAGFHVVNHRDAFYNAGGDSLTKRGAFGCQLLDSMQGVFYYRALEDVGCVFFRA